MRSQVYRDLLAAYQENMASGFYAQFQPHTLKELLQALYELSTQGHHSLHVIGDKVSMLLQGKQLQTSAFSPGRPAPAPTPAPITYEQVIHTLTLIIHTLTHTLTHTHTHGMPCHAMPTPMQECQLERDDIERTKAVLRARGELEHLAVYEAAMELPACQPAPTSPTNMQPTQGAGGGACRQLVYPAPSLPPAAWGGACSSSSSSSTPSPPPAAGRGGAPPSLPPAAWGGACSSSSSCTLSPSSAAGRGGAPPSTHTCCGMASTAHTCCGMASPVPYLLWHGIPCPYLLWHGIPCP